MSTDNAEQDQSERSLLNTLFSKDRVVFEATLEVANGHFLQPTSFPDITYCVYRDQDGKDRCLVESEQSMANRLESVCMQAPGVWVDDLNWLPIIKVKDADGNLIATNLTEPHRLASSYVLQATQVGANETVRDLFARRFGLIQDGKNWPLEARGRLVHTVFSLDPAALLHGFQFVQWDFVGLRGTRLLHSRLEAELTAEPEVNYGMVKVDNIEPESAREKKANKGQSIAAKRRLVPKRDGIKVMFELDLLGLRNLPLVQQGDSLTQEEKKTEPERRQKFLLALALWKIWAFLSNRPAFDARSGQTGPALRLRSDCYLHFKSSSLRWFVPGANPKEAKQEATEVSDEGNISLSQLKGAAGAGLTDGGRPDLRRLFIAVFPQQGDADQGATEDGDATTKDAAKVRKDATASPTGPAIEVTYVSKKKDKDGGKSDSAGTDSTSEVESNAEPDADLDEET